MKIVPLTLLGLAACAPIAPLPEPSGPCAVTEPMRARYIGAKFRTAMREEVQRAANARTLRVLRPGDAATMDFRPDRLDVLLDDGGQVDGLRCG